MQRLQGALILVEVVTVGEQPQTVLVHSNPQGGEAGELGAVVK